MIPIGYMAKRNFTVPEVLGLPNVADIYSVSNCVNDNFADYVDYWKHNGHWFFDRPEVIQAIAVEHSLSLSDTLLFFYQAYEREFTGEVWRPFSSWDIPVNVVPPPRKELEGFDVVTFWPENSPQPLCSPLSCNRLAKEVPTNAHCLFPTLESAEAHLNAGSFRDGEPGPFRIIEVSSVEWPPLKSKTDTVTSGGRVAHSSRFCLSGGRE